MRSSSSTSFHVTLQAGETSFQIDGDESTVEEVSKLRELPDDVRRRMVAGHAAASLAFISDLLLSPNIELTSVKKVNEDLVVKTEKLTAEVARWKTAAETTEDSGYDGC
jgi:hypothetical protein